MIEPPGKLAFLQLSTWDADVVAVIRAHYLGSRGAPPGKKLAWRILEAGRHRGWIGLGEPAYKLAARRALGLADARPLVGTVCCWMFKLEAPGEAPGTTRASGIIRAWHEVSSREWSDRYGWEPIHWETLVDPAQVMSVVPGACFRRAGYRHIGQTTGRTCHRPPGHTHDARVWGDGTPKMVFYRGPLHRQEPQQSNASKVVSR